SLAAPGRLPGEDADLRAVEEPGERRARHRPPNRADFVGSHQLLPFLEVSNGATFASSRIQRRADLYPKTCARARVAWHAARFTGERRFQNEFGSRLSLFVRCPRSRVRA